MQEGVLELPPELAAHVERCPHCSGQAREVETLFKRLRSMPSGFDLGPVPGIVDKVLSATATDPLLQAGVHPLPSAHTGPRVRVQEDPTSQQGEVRKNRPTRWRWVLGQVAAVAAVIAVAVTGLTYLSLMVNQAVSGVKPSEVVGKWVAPLQDWTQALFENTQ
jgi:hypothetical protein